MGSRLDWKVNATPVAAVSAGENVAVDTIAADLGRSIGGGGSITVTWGDTLPATFPTYMSCDTTGVGTVLDSDSGNNDFIWIKNTGKVYSAPTVLGEISTSTVDVKLGSGGAVICTLAAGEGILIPKPGTTYNSADDYYLTSSSDTIAIEWAVGT
ncbi:hypothetical protein CMI47_21820 [Candidatus Pacearchaeota archaeon]|jgi:hypothetical protein|nr:hypothetical protein [Candidatus Pacearchaeota archaeon]